MRSAVADEPFEPLELPEITSACPGEGPQTSTDAGLDAIRAQIKQACEAWLERADRQNLLLAHLVVEVQERATDAGDADQAAAAFRTAVLERLGEGPAGVPVKVSNALEVEGVEESLAGVEGTLHADFWAMLGMFCGGAVCVFIWKAVRP